MADNVMFKKDLARWDIDNYLIDVSVWLEQRETELKETYAEAHADIASKVAEFPSCTPDDGIQPIPDLPELRQFNLPDASAFGKYAPCMADGDEYQFSRVLTVMVDVADPEAEQKLIDDMVRFQEENPTYAEDMARIPPLPVTRLHQGLLDYPSTSSVPPAAHKTRPTAPNSDSTTSHATVAPIPSAVRRSARLGDMSKVNAMSKAKVMAKGTASCGD